MSYETEDKMVSHPDHYQSGKYEVIDIIDEFTKDLSGTEAVCTANAIKYILRWKKKNGVQDVKKAIWYLTHLVEHLDNKEREEHAEFDEYRLNKLTMPVDASRSSEGINEDFKKAINDWKPKLEPGCDKCEISECRFLKDPFINPPYDQLWNDFEEAKERISALEDDRRIKAENAKALEKKYANMTDYAADMERNYCEAEQKIEELEAKNQKLWDICGRLKDDNKELEAENLQLKADYQNLENETKDKLVALTKENCQLREEIERLRETYETEASSDVCGSCKHFNPDQGRCTFDMHFPEKDYWDEACKYFFAKKD
jgi:DNA repair exonuclease SbcCD ATPase subunit